MSDFSIDSNFARFGSTRYATDKITSFRIDKRHKRVQGSNDRFLIQILFIGVIVFGVALLTSAIEDRGIFDGLKGIGLIGVGVAALWWTRTMAANRSYDDTVFRLVITTNAGEVAVMETTARTDIDAIETALEQAILDARR